MPVKISIEADNINMVQAVLIGMTRALAEETSPAVTSDQAPSDIVQHPELPFEDRIVAPTLVEPAVEPAVAPAKEQKKRGRPPKASHPVKPVQVEDVEPPPEVITEEEEHEAEGAVDAPEPEPEGITVAKIRETVNAIMNEKGIPVAIKLLAEAGYRQVSDIPPVDYDRVHTLLKAAG
jgi:hypothetical protein